MREWEAGDDFGMAEAALVTIVQIAHGWSDADVAAHASVDENAFESEMAALDSIRHELGTLVHRASTRVRLSADGFGTRLDVAGLHAAWGQARSAAARAECVADVLSTTAVGLYLTTLADMYVHVGEGRVETIKAILAAEQAERRVSGTIIFDTSKRIQWRREVAVPGYDGVAGLFAELLGDKRLRAFAALSSELYLTYDEEDPLPPRVASFIESALMCGDVAEAILALVMQGLGDDLAVVKSEFAPRVRDYIASLSGVRARRLGEFRRRVLWPVARAVRKPLGERTYERLRARLLPGNVHLDDLITTFFDYADLARQFRHARLAHLEQVSGQQQPFFVVPMGNGRRKQLMYELTSRIVDAEELAVNLVIVSTWARTGWNVLKPNVLIDATATRDVTAWQQLRGRAIRAPRSWTNECYRQLAILASGQDDASAESGEALRIELLMSRNKVTHIYELVKAYGSTRQVEYDRVTKRWRRREAIARKHAYEHAPSVLSGEVVQGAAHAPLLYRDDPRTDLPADLDQTLAAVLDNRDREIIRGWLRAAPE